MAKVTVTFCQVGNRSIEGGSMPVPRFAGSRSEVLASGSASVASTLASGDPPGSGFVSVTAEEGAVWIACGAAPVAQGPVAGTPTPGFLILDGQTRDFALDFGDRVAVVDR